MKKLLTASIIACSVVMGVGIVNTNAEAASGNSIDTVKQLIKGDQSLENVKIGESIKDVLTKYKNPMYSTMKMELNIITNSIPKKVCY